MNTEAKCLVCGENSHTVPLVHILFQEKALWVCSQHLPMLIHKPEEIVQALQRAVSEA